MRLIKTGFLVGVLALGGCGGNTAILEDIGKIAAVSYTHLTLPTKA